MLPRHDLLVSDLCAEIDELRGRLARETARADDFEAKYHDELSRSIDHSKVMIGNLLVVALEGGIRPGGSFSRQEVAALTSEVQAMPSIFVEDQGETGSFGSIGAP